MTHYQLMVESRRKGRTPPGSGPLSTQAAFLARFFPGSFRRC